MATTKPLAFLKTLKSQVLLLLNGCEQPSGIAAEQGKTGEAAAFQAGKMMAPEQATSAQHSLAHLSFVSQHCCYFNTVPWLELL